MNRIFKTVWNRVRRCYVAVNETVTSASQATGKQVVGTFICCSIGLSGSCLSTEVINDPLNINMSPSWTASSFTNTTVENDRVYTNSVSLYGRGNFGRDHVAVDRPSWTGGDNTAILVESTGKITFTGQVRLHGSHEGHNDGSFVAINNNGTVILAESSIANFTGYNAPIYNQNELWIKGKWTKENNYYVISQANNATTHANGNFFVKSTAPASPTKLKAINLNIFKEVLSDNYKTGGNLGSTTNLFTHNSVGRVYGNIDVIDYSENSVVADAIKQIYGKNYNIVFSGSKTGTLPEAATTFNIATVNALTNEGYRDYTYYEMDLVGEGQTISLGGSGTGNLIDSGGFRTISDANGASVDGAKTLTLIGTGNASASMMNGTVALRNGTLQLGHALVTSGGKLSNVTTTKQSALQVAKGNFTIDSLNVVDGAQATINNGSSLAVGRLDSTGTLNVGGTLKAGNGSVLNGVAFTGGAVSALFGTAQLNAFTGNGWVGADSNAHLNVNTDQAISLRNNGGEVFSDHMITLTGNSSNHGLLTARKDLSIVGTVANDNGTVDLKQGFVLGSNSLFNNGTGTVKTVFGNLFDNGTDAIPNGLHTIGRQAVVPQEIRETLTDLFTKYVPGSVKEDVLAHMTFNGAGKVVITNANLTTTQRDDLVKAFKEKIVAL